MTIIRTLVLSGGGGRGAFHAGVYKYLCETSKPGVDNEHQGSWTPDIIVGTSIGAVNGAAITQGYSGEELVELWRGLREQDIQGLPPTMSWLSRSVANRVLRGMIGVSLPRVPKDISTSPPPEISPALLPGMGRFSRWLLGRWGSLLDTGPLRRTLVERMKINEQSLAQSQRTLLINATNVSTGQRAVFSNRPIYKRGTTQPRSDVTPGITIQRILASCSIPLVYPWTVDDETHAIYWDGALVSNTPMGAALDAAANRPDEDVMEVVVVMMTPWRTQEDLGTAKAAIMPKDFGEAITYALDWVLLASFRERIDLIEAFNRLGKIGRELNDPLLSKYREVRVTIVAPEDFFPAARILDYDEHNKSLIASGYQAAEKAFCRAYGSSLTLNPS